jgi:hypothetical protein
MSRSSASAKGAITKCKQKKRSLPANAKSCGRTTNAVRTGPNTSAANMKQLIKCFATACSLKCISEERLSNAEYRGETCGMQRSRCADGRTRLNRRMETSSYQSLCGVDARERSRCQWDQSCVGGEPRGRSCGLVYAPLYGSLGDGTIRQRMGASPLLTRPEAPNH